MRRVLREVGRIEVPGAKVRLRMTQGVHSDSSFLRSWRVPVRGCFQSAPHGAALSR